MNPSTMQASVMTFICLANLLEVLAIPNFSKDLFRPTEEKIPLTKVRPILNFAEISPKLIEARQHGKIVLDCSASGIPAPQVTWLKNGVPVYDDNFNPHSKEDNLYALGSLSQTSSKLFLECITEEDAGLYECVADNKFITKSIATKLNVVSYPMGMCDSQKFRNLNIAPPTIHLWMDSFMERLGSTARLICRTKGNNSFQWFTPNNEPISENDSKYLYLSNGDLLIKDLTFDDVGVYRCVVSNDFGNDERNTFLYPFTPLDKHTKDLKRVLG